MLKPSFAFACKCKTKNRGEALNQTNEENDLMQLVSCRAIVAACVAVLLAGGNVAFARPSHHHHSAHRSVHHHHQHYARHGHAHVREYAEAPITNQYYSGPGAAKEYAFSGESDSSVRPRGTRTHHRRILRASAASYAGASSSGIGGGSIVADARRYLGTNPTGRRSLWCGAFMDKVLRETGHRGGGNLAKGYLHYGQRVSGPQVGAIAVMGRRGGGHVGVVSGIDERGNPIIISGNHNRTVAESVYPRSRILAYVMPGT
jgi:uncharacterized protein (TIGR02594 family)